MNLLNLAAFDILAVDELNGQYRVSVQSNHLPRACPQCGSLRELYRFGGREREFFDLPMHGRRVVLRAFIQRFRYRDCGATFYEDPPDLSEKRHATRRFVDYVGPETLKRTFVSVATEVGVDEKTIRNIFKDHIAKLEASTHFETPEWLGIDEVHLSMGRDA